MTRAARRGPEQPVVIDEKMKTIFEMLVQLRHVALPVLLVGETGTGKEVVAEWLHRSSVRSGRSLVKVNCAGLTETVVESELFGHERGAFSGAVQSQQGLFEAADGGTLFLDEIAELPQRTQAKLLRVLESGELTRVGSTKPRHVDVRFVAATHRDLPQLCEQGTFRQDLYFRLDGITIEIPPLRERVCEIMPIAAMVLERSAAELKRAGLAFHPDAAEALVRHSWPGNIRELRNVVARAAGLCTGALIRAEDFAFGKSTGPFASTSPGALGDRALGPTRDIRSDLEAFERTQILAVLAQTGGNQTQAAKLLGVSRRTLSNKLNKYGVERPRSQLGNRRPLPASDFPAEESDDRLTPVWRN
jgi:two-component system, NtrC family, response regulator AtoC